MASIAYTNDLADLTDQEARRILNELLDGGATTVSIERDYKFNRGLIPFVLGGGHSPTVLEALGLPVYERREVPVCLECGEVHTMHKTCSAKKHSRPRYRKSADMRSRQEQLALDKVALDNGFKTFTEMCRFIASQKVKGNSIWLIWEIPLEDD